MTEESSTKQVSFSRCLYHETKKAYAPWLKVIFLGLIVGVIYAIIYYTLDIIIESFAQLTQLTNIVPWYVYIGVTLLLLPVAFAIGVCITKRTHHNILIMISNAILLVVSVLICIFAVVKLNTFTCSLGLLGIMFAIGILHDEEP